MANSKYYCVIMGGGVGSRFWPMSREHRPKQFIDVFATGRSLLQMTYDRFVRFVPKENILVVTHHAYRDLTLEQLPELKPDQILLEPMRRNTAPCISYASLHIASRCADANVVVSPADHLILNVDAFQSSVTDALGYVERHADLVTLGVRPSRPDTGYGYIQMSPQRTEGEFYRVKTFTEKPTLEVAEAFVSSREFLWNSGMFVWNVQTILRELDLHLPDLQSVLTEGASLYGTAQEQSFVNEAYGRCPKVSIDYGLMEKADCVTVLPVDFGWADLGTWGSVYALKDKDETGNVTLRGKAHYYEANGNIVSLEDEDSLVLIQGLEDCIIAHSEKALLICKRSEEQRVKDFLTIVSDKHSGQFD